MKTLKAQAGFTLVELMIVVAIIGILAAVAIPNFIAYRNKAFCSMAENDAHSIAGGLADYYAVPSHVTLVASYTEVFSGTLSGMGGNFNTATISGNLDSITITVTDVSGRCPADYQGTSAGWSGGVYTLVKSNE